MLTLPCPWCGPRPEPEFAYGGQAAVARPPPDCDDATWSRYLHVRDNPAGPHRERWCHAFGCGQWFDVVRDTRTHEILEAGGAGPAQ